MTSENENPDVVAVVAPVVKDDGGKEEPLESEFPKKLEIGEGSKGRKSVQMSKKMIVLKSSDGEIFEIDEAVAVQSQTIAHIVEDGCATNEIPLANVTGEVLSKVIEYCRKHVGDSDFASDEVKEDLKKWDAEFMDMDQSMMFELILASSYLNANGLLDLVCQTVADMVAACKSVEEIREKFDIENDYTPEEEEQVRKENQWAFE